MHKLLQVARRWKQMMMMMMMMIMGGEEEEEQEEGGGTPGKAWGHSQWLLKLEVIWGTAGD